MDELNRSKKLYRSSVRAYILSIISVIVCTIAVILSIINLFY